MGGCVGKKANKNRKTSSAKNGVQTGVICSPPEPGRKNTNDTENATNQIEIEASYDKVIRILPMFEAYSQGTGIFHIDSISASTGLEQFLKDLNCNADTTESFYLAYELQIRDLSRISKSEFVDYCLRYPFLRKNTLSIDTFRSNIHSSIQDLCKDKCELRQFFRYIFLCSNPYPERRYLEMQIALPLLEVLLLNNSAFSEHRLATELYSFFKDQGVQVIKKDEWEMIPVFLFDHKNGVDQYDPDGEWPSLFDRFVNIVKAK